MPATTLSLTIETPLLGAGSGWSVFESLAVAMGEQLPVAALAEGPRRRPGAADRSGVRAGVGAGAGPVGAV